MSETYEVVQKIFEGHLRGHCDLQKAVYLLEKLWGASSEVGKKEIENALWTTLSSQKLEPAKQAGGYSADLLRVVVRAIAAFGPTPNLPSLVFGRLDLNDVTLATIWANSLCLELSYSVADYAERFTEGTLEMTKARCAPYTFVRSADLTEVQLPEAVKFQIANLETTIEHIQFTRFAGSLTERVAPQQIRLSEFERLFTESGMPAQIKVAMEDAERYLRGTGQFDAKHAAGLIRACMDEAHRAIVTELEKTGARRFLGPDKDGDRRSYMCAVGFINKDEETFISCVYTLISREGVHKLLAPRETVLVMQRTVRDLLTLLLRRLVARRAAPRQ